MNIGMLLDKEFYGDLRVENEVRALSESGFNLYLYCFTFDGIYKKENYFGTTIVHIPVSKSISSKLKGLTNTFFNFYPNYIIKLIIKYLIEHKIDVLHIHDLHLFETGLKIKEKLNKIILVGDLHENYVEGLKSYKFANTFPGNLLISIKKWQNSEIEWCKKFDYLITVIEEAVERYTSLGIDRKKMYVVSNYVNLDIFRIDNPIPTIINKFNGHHTLTYVGGFDTHRWLESAIKAVPIIKDHFPDFKLVLVGDGRNFQDLKLLAKKLNVEKYIAFEGWQTHTLFSSYIQAADICLIPHLKTGHTDNTIPHKLFQYTFLKKPIISSNCNPIERILLETNAGVVYESNNENDLAEKTIQLFNNSELLKVFGENGYEAVIKKYNWNETKKTLIDLYLKINLNKTANG